jgi:hypothetical protein
MSFIRFAVCSLSVPVLLGQVVHRHVRLSSITTLPPECRSGGVSVEWFEPEPA